MKERLSWTLIRELAPPDVTEEAFRKARERGRVPQRWHGHIIANARHKGLDISPGELESPLVDKAA